MTLIPTDKEYEKLFGTYYGHEQGYDNTWGSFESPLGFLSPKSREIFKELNGMNAIQQEHENGNEREEEEKELEKEVNHILKLNYLQENIGKILPALDIKIDEDHKSYKITMTKSIDLGILNLINSYRFVSLYVASAKKLDQKIIVDEIYERLNFSFQDYRFNKINYKSVCGIAIYSRLDNLQKVIRFTKIDNLKSLTVDKCKKINKKDNTMQIQLILSIKKSEKSVRRSSLSPRRSGVVGNSTEMSGKGLKRQHIVKDEVLEDDMLLKSLR